jgi:hypothetical protein
MMGAMDHSEVREILEDAAIEPNGLERLMAGDTAAASIVAGHLAGCPDCAEELERLRRSVGVIRPSVQAVPPPELRARTLAYVAALGRHRGGAAAAATEQTATAAGSSAAVAEPRQPDGAAPVGAPPVALASRRIGPARLARLAGLAAALIVAVTGTALLVNASHEASTRHLTAEVAALGDVARWTLRVDSEPDARRVALAGAMGANPEATGTLVFSPVSTELVVVAEGLAPAPAGREYRCWVEVDGDRALVGKMFFGGGLAYWVGEVPEVAGVPPQTRFGVTLVDLGGAGGPSQDVLVSGG